MRFQNVALAVLLVLAGGIVGALLSRDSGVSPLAAEMPAEMDGQDALSALFGQAAYGQVAGFTQNFIGVTGEVSSGIDVLYLFDTKRLIVATVYYDQSKKEIVPGAVYSMARAFGR